MFADNTTLYCSSHSIQDLYNKISKDLDATCDWFKANKLTLNISKTNYVLFTRSTYANENQMPFKIGTDVIKKVSHVKFLGITIDEKLDWNHQINNCKNKILSGTYAINSLKNILPIKQLMTLYYSLIHPYLNYGVLLWGGAHKKYTHKLAVLQNKSIRKISNSTYNASAAPLYSKLNILTLDNMYKFELCKLMYLSTCKLLPKPLLALYKTNTDIHNHDTRHKNDAHITTKHSDLLSRSFLHRAPELWLSIPDNIKQARTMNSFKSQTRKYLKQMSS